MTDLLSAVRRTSPVARALTGGLVAVWATLVPVVAVALAGWFATDAGRYGDTLDATRVGAGAWVLAHGGGLRLDAATVTVLPLGLTLLCVLVTYRVGRWVASSAGLGAARAELRAVLHAVAVMATSYGLLTAATAVLVAHPGAETAPLRALAGGVVLAAVTGGAGLVVGSGQARALLGRLPAGAGPALRGAAAVVLLQVAGAAGLVAAALLLDFGTAATVLSRLHADGAGGLMYTLVGSSFVPYAVLLGSAYLLGPCFAVGTGTVVSPTAVVLGPLPSFPLLAALPDSGATPTWTTALLGVPVVLTAVAVAFTSWRAGMDRLDRGALLGLASGLLAAVVLTSLVGLAGGAVGPGRMADVGADAWATLLAAAVSCGGGGLVGGVVGAWWSRRRTSGPASVGGR